MEKTHSAAAEEAERYSCSCCHGEDPVCCSKGGREATAAAAKLAVEDAAADVRYNCSCCHGEKPVRCSAGGREVKLQLLPWRRHSLLQHRRPGGITAAVAMEKTQSAAAQEAGRYICSCCLGEDPVCCSTGGREVQLQLLQGRRHSLLQHRRPIGIDAAVAMEKTQSAAAQEAERQRQLLLNWPLKTLPLTWLMMKALQPLRSQMLNKQ
ncbi:uncharacterized protein LOC125381642 [Haliotis rufescens]|uniref:uncharacterized protein LOC125381642 n=1 Tax=Haliotis rufescens TaxID=6454 RepID=UPI00201EC2CB|nr:uncharacterized protein LOC125381642 [Haliotis rufescens]